MSGFSGVNWGPVAPPTPAGTRFGMNIGNGYLEGSYDGINHNQDYQAVYTAAGNRWPDLIQINIDFSSTWAAYENLWWFLVLDATGVTYRNQVMFTAPPMLSSGTTLAAAANGDYNSHYTTLANGMLDGFIARGMTAPIIIRPMPEVNGNWFPWSQSGVPTQVAGAFRQLVDTFRAAAVAKGVPGIFKFEHNLNIGIWTTPWGPGGMNLTTSYPGTSYVDYIGMDFYIEDTVYPRATYTPAQIWSRVLDGSGRDSFGVEAGRSFAASMGKPYVWSEWGVGGFMWAPGGQASAVAYANAVCPTLYPIIRSYCANVTNNMAYELAWDRPADFYSWFARDPAMATAKTAYFSNFPAVPGSVPIGA